MNIQIFNVWEFAKMNRDLHYGVSEQAKASRYRMDDARALLNVERWRGAMYMAGRMYLKCNTMGFFREVEIDDEAAQGGE